MIKIEIEIKETPLPDGGFYSKIEAMPRMVGKVSDHECHVRDMIMDGLQTWAKKFVQTEGITRSIIAKVPLRRRKKDDNIGDDRRD